MVHMVWPSYISYCKQNIISIIMYERTKSLVMIQQFSQTFNLQLLLNCFGLLSLSCFHLQQTFVSKNEDKNNDPLHTTSPETNNWEVQEQDVLLKVGEQLAETGFF